jgi:membrane protein DedA with SNARE-associated domain
MVLETIANFASQNLILFFITAAFLTALWGDATLIAFVVFSMTFKIPFLLTLSACYLGTLIGDTIWFIIGRKIGKHLEKNKKFEKGFKKIAYYFDKLFGKNIVLTLSVVKMLYGTRVITIFYIAKEKIKFMKFMLANLIATLIWLAVIGGIGVLIGLGFTYILNVFKNIQIAITLLIVAVIIFDLLQKKLNKKIEGTIR